MAESPSWPRAFIWRRLHSLSGLFITLYLVEHLFINSQAALLAAAPQSGFIAAVNAIHALPFLPLIELFLLGVPIALHAALGVRYLRTGESNVLGKRGNKPYLPEYACNWRYTFQRITSWILLLGIVGHVVQMRIIDYPLYTESNGSSYIVRITHDNGLPSVAAKIGAELYGAEGGADRSRSANIAKALDKRPLQKGELLAAVPSFGAAELLVVRETFKMPSMVMLYTFFVLAACFHGFNGLWTFLISWGITLTARSQQAMLKLCTALMTLVAILGVAAIWGTYWITFKG